mmetsp:Transcript_27051/g.49176  ORF Transcript_27051/g.49176 Transcript_27051/m.49176 type:complete len:152 (-) Transcript_27051:586-1041(-)
MTEQGTTRSGGCLCGAVRFSARNVPTTFGVCHCEDCRRWTGSALLEVSIKTEDLSWTGAENIALHASSDWAERAWCKICGTNLSFRHTRQDKWFGSTELPLGIFDDANGFTLSHEIFIDHKPDSFGYDERGHKQLTRADVVALNPDLDDAP